MFFWWPKYSNETIRTSFKSENMSKPTLWVTVSWQGTYNDFAEGELAICLAAVNDYFI